MCRVLIVDDENLIVEGLKAIIPWKELGVKEIFTANDGEEALEVFDKNKIDILISDISMPKMNGLELIKNVKSISSSTKSIILSGYDDFAYAKEAIYLGIENYILKPINEEELTETIKLTIDKIRDEELEKNIEQEELDTIKDNIYKRWITNKISIYELEKREFVLTIGLQYSSYVVALVKIKDKSNDLNKIKSFLQQLVKEKQGQVVLLDNNILAVILAKNTEVDNEKLYYYFKDVISEFKKEREEDIFISIGYVVNNPSSLYKSFESAEYLQDYLLQYGYNSVASDYKINKSKQKLKDNLGIDMGVFNKLLLEQDSKAIDKYLEETFYTLRITEGITPDKITNISIKLLLCLKKAADELTVNDYKINEYLNNLIEYMATNETIYELEDTLREECHEFIKDIGSYEYTPVIRQVVNYVNLNYNEKLSIKTLSQSYNINTSYLGQVFTKEVGMSFSDYVNKVKNEKAKELLLTSNLKINDIAKTVGFEDTSYFYRKFKNYFGVNPQAFREAKQY